MAKRSALENWGAHYEENDGDTEVNVNVIIEAEAEAAEDIIEAVEAETDAVTGGEVEEAAQGEVEEMSELAAVLREHGLNPGMAAVLSITMPLEYYGVVMPGKESMDAAGRNQAHADTIAAALEAKSDGFWAGTKAFFQKAWERIKALFAWIANKITTLKSRVKRAKDSLSGRVFDADAAKSEKDVDEIGSADFLDNVKAFTVKIRETAGALQTWVPSAHVEGLKEYPDAAVVKSITGCPYKMEDGFPVGLDDEDKDFLKSNSITITSALLEDYRGRVGKSVVSMTEDYEEMGKFGKTLKANMKVVESNARFDDKKSSATDDSKEANKKGLGIIRRQVTMFATVLAKANKSCFKVGNGYVAVCAKLRKCSKAG